jgi:hypothetical protein
MISVERGANRESEVTLAIDTEWSHRHPEAGGCVHRCGQVSGDRRFRNFHNVRHAPIRLHEQDPDGTNIAGVPGSAYDQV